eukprot:SAG31_NODE_10_length_40133_cov_27.863041_32_plen_107_part_00
MRVGYVEFSDRSTRYSTGGAPPVSFPLGPGEVSNVIDIDPDGRSDFFTRDYESLARLARSVVCGGLTNYEAALMQVWSQQSLIVYSITVPQHRQWSAIYSDNFSRD